MKQKINNLTIKLIQKIRFLTVKLISVLYEGLREGFTPKHEFANQENKRLLEEHLKYTYGDQKGQVDFLINNVFNYKKFGLKRNGFFVDLACADGVHINNTYFLEKNLGWTGLLFEPNPAYKDSIKAHRTSPLVTACVTDLPNETVRFRIDNGMLGGIISENTDNSESVRGDQLKNAKIIEIQTTTLNDELDKISAPKLIDFLSLDIEGAEWIALRNFDFSKYKFVCMAIERPNESLDMMLDQNGYRQVAHLLYDVMYVHSDFLEDVNFSKNIKFAFTPRKDW